MTDPARYRLRILLRPPSKNDVKPDMGIFQMGRRQIPAAWIRVKRLEDDWRRAIPEALPDQRATGRRRVLFTRVMGPNERYFDVWNLAGGLNSVVIDIIVRKGWLLDDRYDCVDLAEPIQRRAVGDEPAPMTYIDIEDLEEAAGVTPALPGLNLQSQSRGHRR
jgi:hypothetical protein